jgi:hypothetical protein
MIVFALEIHPQIWYSASEDDLETVTCFFAFHETSEEPKKKQYPDVDLLVSKQSAQSA